MALFLSPGMESEVILFMCVVWENFNLGLNF